MRDVDGRDLVMDRVEGPSQLDVLPGRPWRAPAFGRELADLHRRLDAVPPLPGTSGRVVHLDLHPGNELCTAGGPVVIDWSNARAGEGAEDVATTWLLLAAFLSGVDVGAARGALAAVCDHRLHDPNMGPEELAAIRLLAASAAP